MAQGISRYWTEAQEKKFEDKLAACRNFAQRHLVMSIRDLVKYDQRSKEGKRATAQGRLRLATASDEDLQQIVLLEAQMPGFGDRGTMSDRLEELKQLRQRVREKGIRKEALRA